MSSVRTGVLGLACCTLLAWACDKGSDFSRIAPAVHGLEPDLEAEVSCVPGHSVSCVATCGPGHQVCLPGGRAYGVCVCAASALDASAPAPAASQLDAGDTVPVAGGDAGATVHDAGPVRVGLACEADGDCGAGLTCLRSDADPFALGGGPAGGYCATPCGADDACSTPGSVCVSTPGGDYCLRACQEADSEPCAGRAELSCVPLGAGAPGYCRPSCNSGSDCGELRCNPGLGLCIEPPACDSDEDCGALVCNLTRGRCIDAPAIPAGGPCNSDADCPGQFCLEMEGSKFCSGMCEPNSNVGCELYGAAAFCALPIDEAHGLCAAVCDTPADCPQPGYLCLLLGNLNGRAGACVPPLAGL